MRICIIPAKFGSSRLPEKNFSKFAYGLNLTEILLLKLKNIDFDTIIISSENKDIEKDLIKFCDKYLISNVKFHLRDQKLAKDPATIIDVLEAIISNIEMITDVAELKSLIVCLPTSPMVKPNDIKCVLEMIERYPDDRILSVSQSAKPPFNSWSFDDDGLRLHLTFPNSKFNTMQSTRCPQTYLSNGAVSGWNMVDKKDLKRTSTVGYEMPELQAIDIDTLLDFEIAQHLFKQYFDWDLVT